MDDIEAEITSDYVVPTHFPSSVNVNIMKHGDDEARTGNFRSFE